MVFGAYDSYPTIILRNHRFFQSSPINHTKNETPVVGSSIPVFGVKLKRGLRVFWLFFKIGLGLSLIHI